MMSSLLSKPLDSSKLRCGQAGSQILEFGGAIFVFIACLILPLIDLSIIPIKFGLGKSVVANRVRQLAQSETLSEAFKDHATGTSFNQVLKGLGGIQIRSSSLALAIVSNKNVSHKVMIVRPGTIPKNWLPEGTESPCEYTLNLTVDVDIYPLFIVPLPEVKIPGLTGPLVLQYHEIALWESLGRDPLTGEFYLNE